MNKKTRELLIAHAQGAYQTHNAARDVDHFRWYWRGMEDILNYILTIEEMKEIKGAMNYYRDLPLDRIERIEGDDKDE